MSPDHINEIVKQKTTQYIQKIEDNKNLGNQVMRSSAEG
jgi:Zn-dependent oligopeptidase